MPASQPLRFDTHGFHIEATARVIRANTFGGIFHVLSDDALQTLMPPVVVLIPGKWTDEASAQRAAHDYAVLMAGDGSLRSAVALRLSVAR